MNCENCAHFKACSRLIDEKHEELIPCEEYQIAVTVDAAPVVHARWIQLKNENGKPFPWYQCSNCACSPAEWENGLPPHCHCCGAKMDLEDGAK